MELIDQLNDNDFEEFQKHCLDDEEEDGPPYHFLQTYYQMSHGPLDDIFPKLCFPCASSTENVNQFYNKIEAFVIYKLDHLKKVYRDIGLRCGKCKCALFIISKNEIRSHVIRPGR